LHQLTACAFREILLEEKVSDTETMKRENRRIAAMSWGAGDSDEPPPKPSRTPMTDSTSKLFQLSSMDGERTENGGGPQMTYIVAQNPAVLAQLMRENENRGINPSAYTTPASVFNVLGVQYNETTENKPTEEASMKTVNIPAMELIPLKQDNLEIAPDPSSNSQIPSPNQILGCEFDGEASYLPMKSPSTAGLPPQGPDNSKSRSLERNLQQNAISTFTRMSSLERRQQQMQDFNMKNSQRSQSLIRQYSAGIQQAENANMRSASLERNQQLPLNFKTCYSSSFEKFQNPPPPSYVTAKSAKGGSLERSQAIIMNDLMRKYYDQKAAGEQQKPKSGGSLERNVQYQQYLMLQKQQLQQQLQFQQAQVQAQAQAQAQAQYQMQQEEAIEENIYDFGGVHVKSCATIALKKSIERGMLPPSAMMRSSAFDSGSSSPSGPSSLEMNRPVQVQAPLSSFKQPGPGIASRMMIFQQQTSQPVRPLQPHNSQKSPFQNPNHFYNPPPESMMMLPIKEPMQVRFVSQTHSTRSVPSRFFMIRFDFICC